MAHVVFAVAEKEQAGIPQLPNYEFCLCSNPETPCLTQSIYLTTKIHPLLA
jgi:hypothetical protein